LTLWREIATAFVAQVIEGTPSLWPVALIVPGSANGEDGIHRSASVLA